MEYKIVVGESPNELTRLVNEKLNDGWTISGSHQVVIRREQNRYSGSQHMDTLNQLEYTQTMVRELEEDLSQYDFEDENGNLKIKN